MNPLVRIILYSFSINRQNRRKLKKLYLGYLKYDPSWHFFWEGKVAYLRVSNVPKMEELLGLLRYHRIFFEVDKKEWVDNIEITKEYQDSFAHIFHGFSTLAMELTIKDLKNFEKAHHIIQVLERIQHCFLNTVAHIPFSLADMTAKAYNTYGPRIHQPYLVLLSLLNTSYVEGYIRVKGKKK